MAQRKCSRERSSDFTGNPRDERALGRQWEVRLDTLTQERIDALAELASDVLRCEVSCGAVIRAAVEEWLASNEGADAAKHIEAIRTEMAEMEERRTRRHKLRLRIEPLSGTEQRPPISRIRLRIALPG